MTRVPSPTPPPQSAPAAGELNVHLHYALGPGTQQGGRIGNPLFDLLGAVRDSGSIRHAAQTLGCSYRYAWGALKQWEEALGEPLVSWTRGSPARLTPFAERLLWAERRARARIQPHVEALRADLGRLLAEARDENQPLLTICASHDLALPALQQHAAASAGLQLDIRFLGSVDSLRALNTGQCQVAGFHVPALRGAAPLFSRTMKPLLEPGTHKLIGCSRRQQGLMLRREHAGRIRTLRDLLPHPQREPLRFVNRQQGSGTRLLIDHLMHEHGLDASLLPGYHDHVEQTHVAVGACIASGAADVGPGVEAAAIEFGLHFVPLIEEDYFLACLKDTLATPALQRLSAVLAAPEWTGVLDHLPGYRPATQPGKVLRMTEALPWWKFLRSKPHPKGAGPAPADATEDPPAAATPRSGPRPRQHLS